MAPTRPFYKQVLTPSTSPSTRIAERPESRGFEVLSDWLSDRSNAMIGKRLLTAWVEQCSF
ncbi:hypothetical protein CGRA01v4_05126 [Colletotrichum graminicola]|nr:hypothetical protein CGRA01v4_05126 [Colletotrichum graminicola]